MKIRIIKEEVSSRLREQSKSKTVNKIPDRAVLVSKDDSFELWQINDAYLKSLSDGTVWRIPTETAKVKWSEV